MATPFPDAALMRQAGASGKGFLAATAVPCFVPPFVQQTVGTLRTLKERFAQQVWVVQAEGRCRR
jgi:hypothetical protein